MYYSLILSLIISCANGESRLRFDNYQVYRLIPQNIEQLKALQEIEQTPGELDFWRGVSYIGQNVDVMVPPRQTSKFEEILAIQDLQKELLIEDVQEQIDRESISQTRATGVFDWTRYHTLEEINDWLNSLSQSYPGIVSVVEGGETYEGRKILGVKISFKPNNKGVFLEGGIHAREWISPATVTYIVNQFLTSNDTNIRAVADSRDWYVFPVINPDGYVYTQINRFWRKTRKPYGACYGADPNRNWGYHWNDGGVSNSSCAATYAGSSAFSEIETKSLSKFINTIADNLNAYFSFHSFSQLLLVPFGHSGHEKPANNKELLRIGRNAMKVLERRYGTEYKVGNIPEAIYVASGGSVDWVLGTHRHIRLAYTYELRDTGRYGFVLPTEQIIPTGEETLDSLISIFQQADSKV